MKGGKKKERKRKHRELRGRGGEQTSKDKLPHRSREA